mmetsp:Transcript_17523/g.36142  ORF Transcript_17523/g.36142 Transcript_17523/m.36142 type:complete len:286 (-) Transcript_17523:556-1413(-)
MFLAIGFVCLVQVFDLVHREGLWDSHRFHLQAAPVDFALALQSFGVVHGIVHVLSDDNCSVVPHEDSVVFSQTLRRDLCQLLGTVGVVVCAPNYRVVNGFSILGNRRSSVGIRKVKGTQQFTNCVVSRWKGYTAAGQCAGINSMGVHNRTHVRSRLVDTSVELEFTRGLELFSRQRIAIHVAMDNFVGFQLSNVDSRGRNQKGVFVDSTGDVSIARHDHVLFGHELVSIRDFLAGIEEGGCFRGGDHDVGSIATKGHVYFVTIDLFEFRDVLFVFVCEKDVSSFS